MRTTLTIEPSVASAIRKRMTSRRQTMKQVINEALRTGLKTGEGGPAGYSFQVEPHACGFRAGVDPDKLNQLLDELEVEERSKRLQR